MSPQCSRGPLCPDHKDPPSQTLDVRARIDFPKYTSCTHRLGKRGIPLIGGNFGKEGQASSPGPLRMRFISGVYCRTNHGWKVSQFVFGVSSGGKDFFRHSPSSVFRLALVPARRHRHWLMRAPGLGPHQFLYSAHGRMLMLWGGQIAFRMSDIGAIEGSERKRR